MTYRGTAKPQSPARLYRDPEGGKILGVCAGIADFFGFNPWAVRPTRSWNRKESAANIQVDGSVPLRVHYQETALAVDQYLELSITIQVEALHSIDLFGNLIT